MNPVASTANSDSRTAEPDRIFVELASEGCGVGCRYCYIAKPASKARPLPITEVQATLDRIAASLSRNDSPPPLLSLACDTEIGTSRAMLDNAEECLHFAARNKIAVQFATKFRLPSTLISLLNEWPVDSPKPVAFTTITTVERHQLLEPGAPHPDERAENFVIPRKRWLSYALVKPFNASSTADSKALLNILLHKRPDGAVVGVRYRRRPASHTTESTKRHEHPYMKNWIAETPTQQAKQFAQSLQDAGIVRFASTRCATAWHNATGHGQVIYQRSPHLCTGCGICATTEGKERGRSHQGIDHTYHRKLPAGLANT